MSDRPQLLLVPSFTEVQWAIRPQLEEWADVASYDPPGVGDEPPVEGPLLEAIVARGVAELDRRGFDRCVVVGDDFGSLVATLVAATARERLAALALGHTCIEHRFHGERPTMNAELADMARSLVAIDFRQYLKQDVRVWHTLLWDRLEDADALVDAIARRVPSDFAVRLLEELDAAASEEGASLEPVLRELGVPLLFARHEDCLFFTPYGFEDATAAFPEAMTVASPISPVLSPEFAEALRRFCAELPG